MRAVSYAGEAIANLVYNLNEDSPLREAVLRASLGDRIKISLDFWEQIEAYKNSELKNEREH